MFDQKLNFQEESDQIEVGEHFRIEFNGDLDKLGNGFGRVTRYNTKSGLEEAFVQGNFINGLLHGKVKSVFARGIAYWPEV